MTLENKMKRISSKVLVLNQKEKVAQYAQKVIEHNFTEPLENTEKVLRNSVNYFFDNTMGEPILQQSFLKGLFSRLSYKRGIIEKEVKPYISTKIDVEALNSNADFRLIGEIATADRLAKSTNTIKKITMNYEDPTKTVLITNLGNVNKDVTINYNIDGKSYFVEQDIKAGNNANHPFSGVIASVPYEETTMQNYSVINDKYISLVDVQKVRLEQFSALRETHKTSSTIISVYQQLEYINALPLDVIGKNILIQEQLFRAMSTGINIGSPSFYAAYVVPYSNLLHQKFFQTLEPYIDTNIFNDKKTFNTFMKQALVIYDKHVREIASNVKQNKILLKESGLDNIAYDIFN